MQVISKYILETIGLENSKNIWHEFLPLIFTSFFSHFDNIIKLMITHSI